MCACINSAHPVNQTRVVDREMSFNREVLVCSVIGAVGLTATAAGLCLLTRKVYKVLIAVQIIL